MSAISKQPPGYLAPTVRQSVVEGVVVMSDGRFAGVDWASEEHAVCVVDERGRIAEGRRYRHNEDGIRALCARLVRLGVALVALERPDGLLIERLLDAGLSVVAVHPNQVKASRPRYSIAGGKCDSFDSFVLAELARTDSHRFRVLVPDSDQTKALRSMTRAREFRAREVGLANQLRDQLACFWPGASKVFSKLDSQIALAFLRKYPTPVDARGLGRAAASRRFWRVRATPAAQPARELLDRLRGAGEGRAGELEMVAHRQLVLALVSALKPIVVRIERAHRARSVTPSRAHPDGRTFRSLFIAPDLVAGAATMLAEIGDCRERYPTYRAARRRRWPSPRRGRVRQAKTRPVPMGMRPPAPRRVRHARGLKPPPQPLGGRHL